MGRIIFVRGVTNCSMHAGSMFIVAGSTSQKTGLAPCKHTAFAVELNV